MLKRKFNLILLVFAIFIVFGLTSCDKDKTKEDEKVIEISSYFDLTDEKEYWSGSIDNHFHPDKVKIIFKKTTEYPELTIEDFGILGIPLLRIKYLALKPKTDFEKYHVPSYRQMAILYLAEEGKEKVLEAIKLLEKIDFIQCAEPDLIYDIEEYWNEDFKDQ